MGYLFVRVFQRHQHQAKGEVRRQRQRTNAYNHEQTERAQATADVFGVDGGSARRAHQHHCTAAAGGGGGWWGEG